MNDIDRAKREITTLIFRQQRNLPAMPSSRPQERHLRIGVSHASGDPARHRTFEIRATYDVERGGWLAWVGEQNLNEQRGDWRLVATREEPLQIFPTAASCLGHAVTSIVTEVDREAA